MHWAIIVASLLRFLDPYTSVYQTDDPNAGVALESEPGYWPVPNGLVDPLASSPKPRFRVNDGVTKEGVPFTGEVTYEMDFSSVTNEGTYFVQVPGVGRSESFRISSNAAETAFRVHMGGLYHKRCGMAKTADFTDWTAGECHTEVVRGRFPPEEGDLSQKVKWFDIIRDNTDWEHGERIKVSGGSIHNLIRNNPLLKRLARKFFK